MKVGMKEYSYILKFIRMAGIIILALMSLHELTHAGKSEGSNKNAGKKPNTVDLEIQHLIRFVKASGCDFVRNGRHHKPDEAVRHINAKHDYFRKKIDSAEKFVELTATQSTMTKNKYKIQCQNQAAVYSSEWLLSELDSFRRLSDIGNDVGL